MPLWASWLRDFDILNIFYEKFKSEKMAKFETLIVPRGLRLCKGQVRVSRRLNDGKVVRWSAEGQVKVR